MHDPLAKDQDWSKATVAVLGLGRSGCGAVRLLRRDGAVVKAFDDRGSKLPLALLAEMKALGVETFGHDDDVADLVDAVDLLVVSPGVRPDHALVTAIEDAGKLVISELELACRRSVAPIIAVTGTNGKSTTVSLVDAILREAGLPSVLAGNIGTAVSDAVDRARADGWLVVECSSFQLERIAELHPRVACVLNVAPDHLDRYDGMDEYAAAKRRLLENLDSGDTYVYFENDARIRAWAEAIPAQSASFAVEGHEGLAAWIEDGFFVRREGATVQRVVAVEEFPLLGAHNQLDALAAVAIVGAIGIDSTAIAAALRRFSPLPHRAVRVPTSDGVLWIDDSKATNVHAASATLGGLDVPVVALLGGRGKGEDYAPLRTFASRLRCAVCFGEEGPAIARALEGAAAVNVVTTMRAAFEVAAQEAQAGDAVLLSPACASFDEFSNFEERGNMFTEWVLAREAGR